MNTQSDNALILEARDRLKARKRLKQAHYESIRDSKQIPEESRQKMLDANHALSVAAARSGARLTDWDREYLSEHEPELELYKKKTNVDWNRDSKAAGRDVKPRVALKDDLARRKRLEKDPEKWLRWYLESAFPLPFGRVHSDIANGVLSAIEKGGNFAVAAPRGSGKSTEFWGLALFCILTGRTRFPAYLPWAAKDLRKGLRFWKNALCFNERLSAAYDEFCYPFRESRGSAQRCMSLTNGGRNTGGQLRLSDGMIVLPDNLGVIGSATINGNPRGLNHATENGEVLRPDLIMIDDPQDKETSRSPQQVKNVIDVIDSDVGGMAGPDKSLPIIMACTVLYPGDVAEHYLKDDNWHGLKVSQIDSWPKNMKLWGEWDIVRKDGDRAGDKGKSARDFYRSHKQLMLDGFAISWDARFDKSRGEPDAFYSAMRDYYHMGHDAFMSERQNEPVNNMETGRPYTITPDIIQLKQNVYERFILPDWAGTVIGATDINPSYALSSCIVGFGRDQTAAVGWYGLHPMDISGNTTAPERSRRLYDELTKHGRLIASLQCRPDLWVIDASGTDFDTALRFCNDAQRLCGLNAIPATGRGSKNYKPWGKNVIAIREQCHMRWDIAEGRRRKWLAWQADHWREIAQRAWLGEVGSPGSCSIYMGKHGEFSDQICRETLMGKADVGGTMIWNWHTQPGKHDFGDCMAMCYAGSAWQGVGAARAMPTNRGSRRASGVSVISM